jgi:hypothetical protein
MTDQEDVIVPSYSSFYCKFLCLTSSVYLKLIYIGCYSKAISNDCKNFRHGQIPIHSGFENDELTVWLVQSEIFTYIKIPLLKPTDAHFCNYTNSKNRLKLHYTLRHVSVRAGPSSGCSPVSVLPPQCAHANTTGWYSAITLTASRLTCTKNHIHSNS